ncbi:MAG: hypothetical protein K2H22_08270, partial [Muribaculaceae bacterium]|nr:hypothetical protein [Muribaculaceae bacterium]
MKSISPGVACFEIFNPGTASSNRSQKAIMLMMHRGSTELRATTPPSANNAGNLRCNRSAMSRCWRFPISASYTHV